MNTDKYLRNIEQGISSASKERRFTRHGTEHRTQNAERRTQNTEQKSVFSKLSVNKDCFAPQKNCGTRNDGMRIDAAFSLFVQNLNRLRQIVDVKTICMHGSPRSKYDNRDIWQKYDYRKLGIIGEPYFDMDFDQFFYLTDEAKGRKGDEARGRKGDEAKGRRGDEAISTHHRINASSHPISINMYGTPAAVEQLGWAVG